VVLNHIAQTAGCLVKSASRANAELFTERDLDAGDVVAVPDRFEEGVGKTEVEDVHDRFFAEEVINAEDRVLRKDRAGNLVQGACRGQVAAEGLLDDDARVAGKAFCAESMNHRPEQRRGNRQIKGWALGATQSLLDGRAGFAVGVVSTDVLKQRQHLLEGARVINAAGMLDAVFGAPRQSLNAPLGNRNPNDG